MAILPPRRGGTRTDTRSDQASELRYERFVVPVGGTAADDHALRLAFRVAPPRDAALTLLYVVEVPQSMPLDAELPADVARGEAALGRAEKHARALAGKGVQIASELLQSRSAGAAIVDEAVERHADVVILTTAVQHRHGRPTFSETVKYVMINAPCDVLVVRLATGGDTGTETPSSWR